MLTGVDGVLPVLDEASEWCHPRTGSNHDNRPGGVVRETQAGVANEDRDANINCTCHNTHTKTNKQFYP